MQGHLDGVGLRSLWGWAMDDRGSPARLIASVDGQVLARFAPSRFREDLTSFSQEPLGFELELERTLTPGVVVAVTDEDGNHLGGSPRKVEQLTYTRRDKALIAISRGMKILEIGPSYNPMAPRSEGWNSFSLDHASQEVLKAKYQGQQLVASIELVDFIWQGGPLHQAVPEEHHGTFDAVVASHVIEHFPDPIGFYLSAQKLLRPGGLISLVIPDKRVTFDFFKPLSTTGDLLLAHHEQRTRHTRKTAFDNIAMNAFSRDQVAWAFRPFDAFSFPGKVDTLDHAKLTFDQSVTDESGPYSDFHNTIYTPASYALSMLELGQLGVLPYRTTRAFPTEGCEFFVTLQVGEAPRLSRENLMQERLRLMKAIVRELGEQAHWLVHD